MNFTEDFLDQAQEAIESVFRSKRDTLVSANGNADHEFKDDKTVVTEFDKQMELDLKQALLKLDAGIGYEGEEFGSSGSRKTFWLVDPIDGTESFIRGLPFFRNMVTLIDNGQPVFTVVYRVVADDLFVAKKGGGAYKNGEKLEFSQRPLERTRIELWTKFGTAEIGPLLAGIEPMVENIRVTDEFLYVVEGKLDVHFAYKPISKPWDHAPRMLLMAETGAKVANIGSDTYDYNKGQWLAANPAVFDQLMQRINQILKVKK